MKYRIFKIIANKGVESLFPSVTRCISDFKKDGYSSKEVKEAIRECYFGIDSRLDSFIIQQGY